MKKILLSLAKLGNDFAKSGARPGKVIREIKAAPEGGVGNLFRPKIVKLALLFLAFWAVLIPLLRSVAAKVITFEQLIEVLRTLKDIG